MSKIIKAIFAAALLLTNSKMTAITAAEELEPDEIIQDSDGDPSSGYDITAGFDVLYDSDTPDSQGEYDSVVQPDDETENTVLTDENIDDPADSIQTDAELQENTDNQDNGSVLISGESEVSVQETQRSDEETEIPYTLLELITAEAEKTADENGEYDLSDADDFSDAVIAGEMLRYSLFRSIKKKASSEAEPMINGFQYVATYTGTAPFDAGSFWNQSTDAGKDFAQKDNIVRSYDEIVYRVAYSTYTDELETQIVNGSFYFQAELPYLSDVGEWDLESMQWLQDPKIAISGEKQILTGHVDFDGGVIAPRIGVLNFSVLIHETVNGYVLGKPTFKMSLQDDMSDAVTAVGDADVTVSAAPEIDAEIKYLGQEESGRPYWGILVSLKHSAPGRGIKGQGLLNPDDDITINIQFPDGMDVEYYDVKSNTTLASGNSGHIASEYYTTSLPFDHGTLRSEVLFDTVYHGGSVTGQQNSINNIELTLSGTEFADLLSGKATHNASADADSGQTYSDDTYPIAAVILLTSKPGGSGDVIATITSVDHTLQNGSVLNDSDSTNNTAQYKRTGPGSVFTGEYGYGPLNVISATNYTSGRYIDADEGYDFGPGYMPVRAGDLVSLQTILWTESAFAADHGGIQAITEFVKFDDEMFEPVSGRNTSSGYYDVAQTGTDSQTTNKVDEYTTVYFVAKADGSGWSDEAEMADAHIDGTYSGTLKSLSQISSDGNYILYANADDIIASGKTAIGFYVVVTDVNETLKANLNMPGSYSFSTYLDMPALAVKDSFQNNDSGLKAMDDPGRVAIAMYDSTIIGLDGQVNRNFTQSSWPDISYSSGVGGAAKLDGDTTFAYRKAVFNADGDETSVPSTTNHWYPLETSNWLHLSPLDGGISFYMMRESAYLNFKITDTFENYITGDTEKKKVYNLDANERTVNLSADFGTSSGGSYPQSTENYTVYLTVPTGAYPVADGSAAQQYDVTFGSEKAAAPQDTALWQSMIEESGWLTNDPSYSVSWDTGNQAIKVQFTGVPAGWAVPAVNYKVHLGNEDDPSIDLINNQNLSFSAHLITENTEADITLYDGLSVVRLGSAFVVKEAMNEKRSIANPDIGFDIHFMDEALQMAAVDAPVEMIDIFPYDDSAKGIDALNPGLNLGDYKIKGFNITGSITKNNAASDPVLEIFYSTADPALLETESALNNSDDPYSLDGSNWTKITLTPASGTDPLTDSARVTKLDAVNGKKITAIGFRLINAGPNSNIDIHYEYDFSDIDEEDRLSIMYGSDIYNRVKVAGGTDIRTETYSDAKTGHTPTAIVLYKEVKTDVQLWHYVAVEGDAGSPFSVASPEIEGYTMSPSSSAVVTGEFTDETQVFTVYYEKDPMIAQQVAVYKSSKTEEIKIATEEKKITYSLRAVNTGVAKSETIYIKDEIPEGTTYVSGSASDEGVYSDGKVTWNLTGLDADAEKTVTFQVTVDTGFNSIVYNKAFYHIGNETGERETNEVYHPTTTLDDLQGPAALSLVKGGTVVSTHRDEGSATKSWTSDATWTAPKTGSYTFTLYGAQGGAGDTDGTKGDKVVTSSIQITEGTTIQIKVGKQGGNSKYTTGTSNKAGTSGSMGNYNQDADSVKENSYGTIPNDIWVERISLSGRSDKGNRTVSGWIGTKANVFDIVTDPSVARPKAPTVFDWGKSFAISGDKTSHVSQYYVAPTKAYAGRITRCKTNGNSGYHNCSVAITAYKQTRSGGTGTGGTGYTSGASHAYGGGGGGSSAVSVDGSLKAQAAGGAGGKLSNPGSQTGEWYASGEGGGTSSGGTETAAVQTGDGRVEVSYSWSDVTTVTDKDKIQNTAATTSIITYTLDLVNNGNETSHGTVITDNIPSGTEYVAGSVTGGGTYNSTMNRLEWWVGDLAPGAVKTCTFQVEINNPVTNYLIGNQAGFGRDYEQAQLSTLIPKHDSNIVEMLIPGYVTVAKQWVGDADHIDTRPSSVTIQLTGSDGTSKTAALTAANGWQHTFTDVPFMTDAQQAVTYQVWETSDIPSYLSSATESMKMTVPSTGTATITNTYSSKKFTITKVWAGDDAADRPASVTFHIKGSDESTYTKTLSAPDWTDTFDVLGEAGETDVIYKVWEEEVDNYESEARSEATAVTADYDASTNSYSASISNELISDFPTSKAVKDSSGRNIHQKTVLVDSDLYYFITVENTLSATRRFVIEDAVPQYTSFVSADNDGIHADGKVTWTVDIPAGRSKDVGFVVKTTTANVRIDNVADVTMLKADNTTPAIAKQTNIVTNYTTTEGDAIKKYVNNAAGTDINNKMVENQSILYYELTVTNTADINKIYVVEDTIPANSVYVEGSADNGGTFTDGKVIWTFDIEAGAEKTLKFRVKADGDGVRIRNEGVLYFDDLTLYSNPVENFTPVRPVKEVFDNKTVDMDGRFVETGDILTYRITVTNTAAADKRFTVTDVLPDGVTFISADNEGMDSNGTVIWTVDVAGGSTKVLSVTVKVNGSSSEMKNSATQLVDDITLISNEVATYRAMIIINKAINNYYEEFGEPTFIYHIYDSQNHHWVRAIEVTNHENGTVAFEVPKGVESETYTVYEEINGRYKFVSLSSSSPNVNIAGGDSGKTGVVTIDSVNRSATLNFVNEIKRWDEVSHSSTIINHISD